MKRRFFLKYVPTITGVTYALPQLACNSPSKSNATVDKQPAAAAAKTHVISLSFDDGFIKSYRKAAEIHENYGTKGCFNVIATAHLPTFKRVGQWILPELMGDFNDWNKLVAAGHEVMPHTWEHKNLTKVSVSEAKERLNKCFDYFADNLDGYRDDKAVYNYAYNASTEELDLYCLTRVKAVRTGHWLVSKDSIINDFPQANYKKPIRLGCYASGPDIGDRVIDKEINTFLASEGGWFIINLHGLDDEGWGPVTTTYFDSLVKRLVETSYVDLLPVGLAIEKYNV